MTVGKRKEFCKIEKKNLVEQNLEIFSTNWNLYSGFCAVSRKASVSSQKTITLH